VILFRLHRRPLALGVVAVLIGLRVAWRPGAGICGTMTMTGCLTVAGLLVALVSLVAVAVRAVWLAVRGSRALAALPRAPVPMALAVVARRAGVRRLVCLAGHEPVAFCAGLSRPSVYVTSGASTILGGEELTAVLVHEQAHAGRRDPLRSLLTRAAADVLVYLPLWDWCRQRHVERAELRADRAAIDRVGGRAIARALMIFDGSRPQIPATTTFEGTSQARVAQLLGDQVPRPSVPIGLAILSVAGLVLAVSLLMCVGQDLWTRVI
jgi:Zn-dependent protease with chaperone function